MVLSVAVVYTHTPHTPLRPSALVVGSVLLGIAASLPLFLLWFFTGWYYIFVILYGAAMGFLMTATLFFTPFGTHTRTHTLLHSLNPRLS